MTVAMTVMAGERFPEHLRGGDLARLRGVLKFGGQLSQRLGLRGVSAILRGGRIGLELRGDAGGDVRILSRALLLDLVQLAEETGRR